MKSPTGELSKRRKKFTLKTAMTVLAVAFLAGTVLVPWLKAQGPPAPSSAADANRPAFDAVSIKPTKPGAQMVSLGNLGQPGGLYRATNATLRLLVAGAYFRSPGKGRLIFGGPGWIDSEHFDIEARAEAIQESSRNA